MEMYDKIIDDAIPLPAAERAMLADQLLDSLDDPDQKRIESLWAEEIKRRLDEYEQGRIKTVPGEYVFQRIRERIRR